MIRYVAFLRGINVGGHKLIRMEDLKQFFESLGFLNIKTYLQTGNVRFEVPEANSDTLTQIVENGLNKILGYEVTVLLRPVINIQAIVSMNPFSHIDPNANVKKYVTFLQKEPIKKLNLPLVSAKKDIEIFSLTAGEVFSLAFPNGKGRFGFPNSLIEKELGILSTTRNWNTIAKLVK